jgi:hypothetical protein
MILLTVAGMLSASCEKKDEQSSPDTGDRLRYERTVYTAPKQTHLVNRFEDSDSLVVLHLDSRKPAKVEIFNCTVERTVDGPKAADVIRLSFLHFPDCQRLSVGAHYLCAIRHNSGTGYTLIRSDMLGSTEQADLRNYAWEADSPEARRLLKQVGAQQDAAGNHH